MTPRAAPAAQAAQAGPSSPTLQQACETFYRLALVGLSAETLKWYHIRLDPMIDRLGGRRSIDTVTLGDILDWRKALETRNMRFTSPDARRPELPGKLSPFTVHGHLRAARRFFGWLWNKEYLAEDLREALRLPGLPRTSRRGISEDDARKIIDEAGQGEDLHSLRDRAIFLFFQATGCRLGGVANLLLTDLNLHAPDTRARRRAVVREKGNKERTVFLTLEAVEALKAWLARRPRVKSQHVFLGCSIGQEWHALKRAGIAEILDRYKERLGISGQVSPHQWRHRFARSRIQNGMDLSQVSQILGHESVGVTVQYYAQFQIDDLQAAYDQAAEKDRKVKPHSGIK